MNEATNTELTLERIFEQSNNILEKLNKIETNNTKTNNKIIDIFQKLDVLKKEVDGVIQSQVHLNTEFENRKQQVENIDRSVQLLLREKSTR